MSNKTFIAVLAGLALFAIGVYYWVGAVKRSPAFVDPPMIRVGPVPIWILPQYGGGPAAIPRDPETGILQISPPSKRDVPIRGDFHPSPDFIRSLSPNAKRLPGYWQDDNRVPFWLFSKPDGVVLYPGMPSTVSVRLALSDGLRGKIGLYTIGAPPGVKTVFHPVTQLASGGNLATAKLIVMAKRGGASRAVHDEDCGKLSRMDVSWLGLPHSQYPAGC